MKMSDSVNVEQTIVKYGQRERLTQSNRRLCEWRSNCNKVRMSVNGPEGTKLTGQDYILIATYFKPQWWKPIDLNAFNTNDKGKL